jgi:hypothetical protein
LSVHQVMLFMCSSTFGLPLSLASGVASSNSFLLNLSIEVFLFELAYITLQKLDNSEKKLGEGLNQMRFDFERIWRMAFRERVAA